MEWLLGVAAGAAATALIYVFLAWRDRRRQARQARHPVAPPPPPSIPSDPERELRRTWDVVDWR